MGTDIHGWIEIAGFDDHEVWAGSVRINTIVRRNYDMFALLFGVRNQGSITPIAPNRGLPSDISFDARHDWGAGGYHSTSWLAFTELQKTGDRLAPDWEILLHIM